MVYSILDENDTKRTTGIDGVIGDCGEENASSDENDDG